MLEGGPDGTLSSDPPHEASFSHEASSSFDPEYLASLECLKLRQAASARTHSESATSTEFEELSPQIRRTSDQALARRDDSELFDSELFVTARGADPSTEDSMAGIPYMMSPRHRRPDYFSMPCADILPPNPATDEEKNDPNAHPFEALVARLAELAGTMQM